MAPKRIPRRLNKQAPPTLRMRPMRMKKLKPRLLPKCLKTMPPMRPAPPNLKRPANLKKLLLLRRLRLRKATSLRTRATPKRLAARWPRKRPATPRPKTPSPPNRTMRLASSLRAAPIPSATIPKAKLAPRPMGQSLLKSKPTPMRPILPLPARSLPTLRPSRLPYSISTTSTKRCP